MRSSLGFHTMSLTMLLSDENVPKLIEDFKRYSADTGLIKMYYNNGDCYVTHSERNMGINWKIKRSDWNYQYNLSIVEVKINPKILAGIHDYVTAATIDDMETAITNFNTISGNISPLLSDFNNYKLQRIDYCINFYIDELAEGCSTELIINLIKKSDIPPHFKEYTEYDEVSHRTKSKPNSFYLMNNSTVINCYDKHSDLQQRSDSRNGKGLAPIHQAIIDSAHGIIRFEIQCKYFKTYFLSNKAKESGNLEYNKYKDLLAHITCNDIISDYFEITIGKGDWYSLKAAIQKIQYQRFRKQKEKRLIEALQFVSDCRSLSKAKSLLHGEKLEAFKRTLKDLSSLRINPVTIPKDKGIKRIPNLLYAYYDKFGQEKQQKEQEELNLKMFREYIKEFGLHF